MDVLPFELIIVIASKDPLAFIKMEQASRAIHLYLQTPAGRNCFLNACTVKRIINDSTITISLITGNRHSFFDMPAVIRNNGDQLWIRNNHLHRTDGPAVMCYNGSNEWWQYDQRHRDDGPAIMSAYNHKRCYHYGKLYYDNKSAAKCTLGDRLWYCHGVRIDTDDSISSIIHSYSSGDSDGSNDDDSDIINNDSDDDSNGAGNCGSAGAGNGAGNYS